MLRWVKAADSGGVEAAEGASVAGCEEIFSCRVGSAVVVSIDIGVVVIVARSGE